MTDRLQVHEGDRVLEIGTGSGYQAAILAELAAEVHTIERHSSLAEETQERLDRLGYDNVQIYVRDGTLGLPEKAPYQGIIVTASAPEIPPALLDQLDDGGRLIMPVGDRFGQVLKLVVRSGDDYQKETLSPVAFVPLIGEQGWDSA
jgi:protein-L-isoaspartate(D-aspartate) O-methyltransferase